MSNMWQFLGGAFRISERDIAQVDSESAMVSVESLVRDEAYRRLERWGVQSGSIAVRVIPTTNPSANAGAVEACHVYVRAMTWSDDLARALPRLEHRLQRALLEYGVLVRGVYWRIGLDAGFEGNE